MTGKPKRKPSGSTVGLGSSYDDVLADLAAGAREKAGLAWMAGAIVLCAIVLVAAFVATLIVAPVEASIIAGVVVIPYLAGKALAVLDTWRRR